MNAASPLSRIYLCCLTLMTAVTISMVGDAFSDDSKTATSTEDPVDISNTLKRYRRATSDDQKAAKQFLEMAGKEVARDNWDGAWKSFAASVLHKPSVRAILGQALAESRGPRERGTCQDEVDAKFGDLELALTNVLKAIAFHRALGKDSDVDDKTIGEYQQKMVESQKMLLEKQCQCLCPMPARKRQENKGAQR